jgi:hypothetical protein
MFHYELVCDTFELFLLMTLSELCNDIFLFKAIFIVFTNDVIIWV